MLVIRGKLGHSFLAVTTFTCAISPAEVIAAMQQRQLPSHPPAGLVDRPRVDFARSSRPRRDIGEQPGWQADRAHGLQL